MGGYFEVRKKYFNVGKSNIVLNMPLATDISDLSGNNFTITNVIVTFDNGKAVFNDNLVSYITVKDNDKLSFCTPTSDLPFSVSLKFSRSNANFYLFSKDGDSYEYRVYYYSGELVWMLYDKTTGGYTQISKVITLTIGTEYEGVFTYTGSGGNTGLEMYINKTIVPTVTRSGSGYVRMRNTGSTLWLGRSVSGLFYNGTMRYFKIYNECLTQSQINNL